VGDGGDEGGTGPFVCGMMRRKAEQRLRCGSMAVFAKI